MRDHTFIHHVLQIDSCISLAPTKYAVELYIREVLGVTGFNRAQKFPIAETVMDLQNLKVGGSCPRSIASLCLETAGAASGMCPGARLLYGMLPDVRFPHDNGSQQLSERLA